MRLFITSILAFTFLVSISSQVVLAQNNSLYNDGSSTQASSTTLKITNPLSGVDDITTLLAKILSAIVQIAIPFLVLAIMYVGFLFVAARGNPQKLAEARQALFYVLLGALIILGSETLSRVLSGTISELTS